MSDVTQFWPIFDTHSLRRHAFYYLATCHKIFDLDPHPLQGL
jgi:hypothetical protein